MTSPNARPIHVQITQEQAEALRDSQRTDDTGEALVKLLMAAAGMWVLGEILKEARKPKARRRPRA